MVGNPEVIHLDEKSAFRRSGLRRTGPLTMG
jgi:hypothetical protein